MSDIERKLEQEWLTSLVWTKKSMYKCMPQISASKTEHYLWSPSSYSNKIIELYY